MRIIAKKTNIGTEVSIFVPSSEINLVTQSSLTSNQIKEFRLKRNFKKSFSAKQLETIQIISEHIIRDFNSYHELFVQLGAPHIIEKLKGELKSKLNAYQFNSIEIVSEIIFAIFFNFNTPYSVETLRKRYSLDTDTDLLVSLVGTFGYGKTTLIKKLLGFDDDYCFLLVDKGRTTINNTIIRALIVITDKDGNEFVWQKNTETDSPELIPVEQYHFKNSISLHSCKHVYTSIIALCLNQAFIVYCKDPSKTRNVLKKFIVNSKCDLDGLFGNISDTTNSYYSSILARFKEVYDSIDLESDEIYQDFTNDEFLYREFSSYYTNSISNALNDINQKTGKTIIYEENSPLLFELTYEELCNGKAIDDCYSAFTSNRIIGNGLRILVNEIYTELDFNVTHFVDNNENFVVPEALYLDSSDEKTCKYHSIVFADTVGCSHLQNSTDSSSSADSIATQDIIANSALLNESDLILLLENATQSMSNDIKGQLFALESLGCKDKVIMCYSFYNQFVKMDILSNEARENKLDGLFHDAICALYPQNPSKAERVYQTFTCPNALYTKNSHIVYLKGLVKRQDTYDTKESKTNNRRNAKVATSTLSTDSVAENTLAHTLNKDFEDCNSCLQELLNKMVLAIEHINMLQKNSFSITNKSTNLDFTISFSNSLYPQFKKDYIGSQNKLYLQIVPAWNTTKALCDNAVNGNAYFSGSSLTLAPLTDALSHISAKSSNFLENTSPIELTVDDEGNTLDKALNTDFLIDQIKNKFHQKLTDYYKLILVTSNKLTWHNLGLDCGSGVQWRRSSNIYTLIEKVYSMQNVETHTLTLLLDSIEEIVEAYKTH